MATKTMLSLNNPNKNTHKMYYMHREKKSPSENKNM